MINKMTTKLSTLAAFALCMISCEGSRPRRMLDALGDAKDTYDETGDPTVLICMIIGLIILGALWIKNQQGK